MAVRTVLDSHLKEKLAQKPPAGAVRKTVPSGGFAFCPRRHHE